MLRWFIDRLVNLFRTRANRRDLRIPHIYSTPARTNEEAWRRDAEAIAGDWKRCETDLETAKRRLLKGRIIAVRYGRHLHEVGEETSYDPQHRLRFGMLRCGEEFQVTTGQMLLVGPRAIDCPICVYERTLLN